MIKYESYSVVSHFMIKYSSINWDLGRENCVTPQYSKQASKFLDSQDDDIYK